MFVEELLLPLTTSRDLEKPIDDGRHAVVLENLLRSLERRPISSQERKLIQNEVVSFMKDSNIKIDDPVSLKLSDRLGYSFLPLVSNLGLMNNNQVDGRIDDQQQASQHDIQQFAAIVPLPNEYNGLAVQPARAGLYYICTLRRIKSPLSTSYKMYLDNILDIQNMQNHEERDKLSPTSVAILGARKMKSGIALVWADTEDARDWKDRTAIGRIFRSDDATYSGRIQVGGKSPSSPNSSRAASPTQYPVQQAQATTATAAAVVASVGDSPPISGPIVCAVRSKGMDKLIHLAAVASPSSDVDEGAISQCLNSMSLNAIAGSPTGASSAPIAAGAVPSSPLPPGCVRLHSKLPRKVSVSAGGRREIHSVAFGKMMSRVRAPSRKNIVIDRVADEGTANNEWISDSEIPPIFQLGKINEDTFALDFHNISPFQAFVLCLAAFDQ